MHASRLRHISKRLVPALPSDQVPDRGGAALLLHGEASFAAMPHLESLLDSVIALGLLSLTVDLSDTFGATRDVLAAIWQREREVPQLHVVGCPEL